MPRHDIAVQTTVTGRAVPIGNNRVTTLQHVVPVDSTYIHLGKWCNGTVVKSIPIHGNLPHQDSVVVIEVDRSTPDAPPVRDLVAGDSGTPLYDAQGNLVGLYWGRYGEWRVFAPIPQGVFE